jgi:hypothetical protein
MLVLSIFLQNIFFFEESKKLISTQSFENENQPKDRELAHFIQSFIINLIKIDKNNIKLFF